ncbi:Septum formation initiator [Rubritalea squalenifaciens DSM 18772]|uniref:Septum formation initiator n=3 Tax=Rubritaleaceae TaxID=1648490 RepID=A0A1M6MJ44_9BACT|nr:Septum formation initiator [Rubritalea squalenifaciens DSM 18772]
MRARTEKMRKLNQFTFCLFIAAVCAGVIVSRLPHFKDLEKMEMELAEVKSHEADVLSRKDQHEREYRALEQDPHFLEIKARDRLDLYKPGEVIFRFQRD